MGNVHGAPKKSFCTYLQPPNINEKKAQEKKKNSWIDITPEPHGIDMCCHKQHKYITHF